MLAQYGDSSDPMMLMLALLGLSIYFGGMAIGFLGVFTLLLKDKRFSFWCGFFSLAWSGLIPAFFGPLPKGRSEWFSPIYYPLTVIPALIAIFYSVAIRRSPTEPQ